MLNGRTLGFPHVFALAAAAALLDGCGGGGGGASQSVPGDAQPIPTSTPAAGGPLAPVSISIVIPVSGAVPASSLRKPTYISPSTNSLGIQINGGTVQYFDVSKASTLCTGSGGTRTCTLSINAPIASDTFVITAYDGQAGGNELATGTVTQAITASANVVSVVLDGIVHAIALSLANATPPANGTPQSIAMTVTATDADGNTIGTGTYASPITLTDSDAKDAPTDVNGSAGTTVSKPTDAVTVAYDGAAVSAIIFSATASGVSSANVTGATLTPSGSISASPTSLTFLSLGSGAAQTITLTQLNGTLSVSGCSGNVSLSATSGASPLAITVTPTAVGTCTLSVTGSPSGTLSVPVSIATTSITVSGKARSPNP
ncbi:MAG TPA: hypothetical protein VNJ51_02495 [Candidatus Dormibacteraeota bacterium]|nr:hypothetical protein [Candidatus Dormibacteraeota bacterium]